MVSVPGFSSYIISLRAYSVKICQVLRIIYDRPTCTAQTYLALPNLDFRFLFILFFMMSLINTVWCIFASPHFPDKEDNDDDEIPDIN